MKSPITGKELKLAYEWREVPFCEESLNFPYQFYLCEESGGKFTSTALDELNMQMIYIQYGHLNQY